MKDEKVYRSSLIPVANSGGLQVRATSLNLLSVLDTGVARGGWLNAGTAREPVAVLGAVAAERLGIDRVHADQRIWLGGQWFNVAGILEPSPLATDIDTSALVGYPAAQKYLGYVSIVQRRADGRPAEHDLRAHRHRPRGGGAVAARADRQPRGTRTRSTSASPPTCSPPAPPRPARSTASSSGSGSWP